jgi:hypothetical protein
MTERRFFCDTTTLTAADRARLRDLAAQLAATRPAAVELGDGYALAFEGDRTTYALVSEWLGYERLCCGFLEIQLTSTPDGGPLVVGLTGAGGVKAFVREEFAEMLGEVGREG